MTKINWFSPLPPEKTDIANYSLRVYPELANLNPFINFYTYQDSWDAISNQSSDIVKNFLECPPDKENDSVNIYNIGNNEPFHSRIYEYSKKNPGIIILHDLVLQDFFIDYVLGKKRSKKAYLALMEKHYGKDGKEVAYRFTKSQLPRKKLYEKYFLTAEIIENAKAVVVHSEHSKNLLLSLAPQKRIEAIPLAFSSAPVPNQFERNKETPFTLILFGFLGGNRRVLEFLKTFSGYENKKSFQIKIYGNFYDPKLLKRTIHKLNLDSFVNYRGFVSEEELAEALDKANLAINLRYPTMHEVSASQLLLSKHGLPSIVSNVGWYATLPNEICYKISIENESNDIVTALDTYLKNKGLFDLMGQKAQEYYLKNHLPSLYVKKLSNLIKELA